MLKRIIFVWVLIYSFGIQAQEINLLHKTKKISTTLDTIQLEKTSINSRNFKIVDANNKVIDTALYRVNFKKAYLILNDKKAIITDSLTVSYTIFPEFLTKEYRFYDESRIVSNDANLGTLYSFDNEILKKKNVPFQGLNTSGSISRGVTIGNNQNSVLNSNLDLQITGKLSEKVSIRASLQDNNIPLQDGGYSQKLDQFDAIFMELFSEKWSVRAGDVFLENRKTQFLNFNKKAQGIIANFDFGDENNKTNIFASAAIVRGQYAKSDFIGKEGNQGPYKLIGQNGELYVLVVSGSERVYVNGKLLKRGDNNDYTIDYNAGEITFTPLFSITSEMRIAVEYQFSTQNYTRLVTYAGGNHESKNWNFGSYLYSENDLKNQPLQQSLSKEQAQVLVNAGDNPNAMKAPSAFVDSYSESKILYKKTIRDFVEIFENSNDSQEVLYNVRFTQVGNLKGNYVLKNSVSVGRIFEYVPPKEGIPQGNFEPIIQLIAPEKTQIATFLGKYNPDEKTLFDFEIGVSNKDKNLFSSQNDSDNLGLAAKITTKKRLFTSKWLGDVFANYQFIAKDFSSIERIFNIEFSRDWNLSLDTRGNQSYWISGIQMTLPEKGSWMYQFEKLDFSENFSGNRHILNASFNWNQLQISSLGSLLNSKATKTNSAFLRNQTQAKFNLKKNWVGSRLRLEDNQEKDTNTKQFSALSQRFLEYGLFAGRGDSTKVFVELGYYKRANDSLQNGKIRRVNQSNTFALKSKLIQNTKNDLSVFINYRILDFENKSNKKEPSLNSRMIYNDRFFNQIIQTTTSFETNSGAIAQQEFTYLEVPIGQGVFTWNDYNNNGIQELEEFETAPFIDQAKYIRVFLPNRVFTKTHQNKFSQSLTLNPNQGLNEKGVKKMLSYFFNQTSFLVDRKLENKGNNFDLNPFEASEESVLGLNSSFRNSLFFNRGKQNHSVTYTFLENENKNFLSVGSQAVLNKSNQLQYNHLYKRYWLFGVYSDTQYARLVSKNYSDKNFEIKGYQMAPKISYLFSNSTSWDVFYEFQFKKNQIGQLEILHQNRFGSAFNYGGNKKFTFNGEISFYQNKFVGNEQTAVAFQMLEGLQTGQNLTWRLLFQKNLTNFLDVNINYQGRKSETSKAIHTGNVQLRAYF